MDCHGHLHKNNNNPWTCRMLCALKMLRRPWAPLMLPGVLRGGKKGRHRSPFSWEAEDWGTCTGPPNRHKRIGSDAHPEFYNLLIQSFTKYLGTHFCVWKWVGFRKYNSNSSCVEIKQLCDCFPLHFSWDGPGLMLCCNVQKFYFVFTQSLFCDRGGRGELPIEQGY